MLAPQNYLEEQFADRAALATWRLRRAARCERGIIAQAQVDVENGGTYAEKLQRSLDDRELSFELERERHTLPIGLAAGPDGLRHDELLARYETAAERALQRVIEGIRTLRALGSVGKKGGDEGA